MRPWEAMGWALSEEGLGQWPHRAIGLLRFACNCNRGSGADRGQAWAYWEVGLLPEALAGHDIGPALVPFFSFLLFIQS
jgi:hypothetical protein